MVASSAPVQCAGYNRKRLNDMTNVIAKAVHCPSCGSPKGRACRALNPAKVRIVPNHSHRKKLYDEMVRHALLKFKRSRNMNYG